MKNDKKPMYQHIVDDLKRKISAGEIDPKQPIPTQIELAKQYGTSEITSRRALTELVNEGLIYRIRGKGSFVNVQVKESRPPIKRIYFVYQSRAVPIILFNHPFYSFLLTGLQEVCEENGVDFHLWDIGDSEQLPDDEMAGFVILPHRPHAEQMDSETLRRWKSENRRLVTVHFYYPHLQIPYVVVDNLTGGFLATQHLLSLGHRRIGIVVTGRSHMEINQEFSLRLQGYRLALSQYRVEFDPQLVRVIEGEHEYEEMGCRGFNELMDLDPPPTAIFLTSDSKAVGAMMAARKRGVKIPEDVSIVGYDDVLASQFLYPSLTTIDQNTFMVGRKAAELLLFEWRDDANARNLRDEIVPKLVVRDSTAEIEAAE